jgi:hypothetical protein
LIVLTIIYKIINKILRILFGLISWIITLVKFKLNREGWIKSIGIPIMSISLQAKVSIGHHFARGNGRKGSSIT